MDGNPGNDLIPRLFGGFFQGFFAGPGQLPHLAPDLSLTATWMALEAMRRLGVPARAAAVRLRIHNPDAVAFRSRAGRWPLPDEPEAGGAYTLTLESHAVAIAGGTLVDAAVEQVNALEARRIHMPTVLCLAVDPAFPEAGQPIYSLVNDAVVEYTPLPAAPPPADSPAWGPIPGAEAEVARIVGKIEEYFRQHPHLRP